jgi:hypothetical protein
MRISLSPTELRIDSLQQANDTTLYKPLAQDKITGLVRRMDGWAGGGGGTQTTIQTTSTYSGSTSFTFTTVPAGFEDYMIFKNGILLIPTTDYTTSGNVVTIPTATTGDKIIYRRIK